MIKGIHHVGLVVRDLAAAQRYYGAAAGMRQLPEAAAQVVAPAHDLAAAPADLSLLAGPNGYLLLIAPRWAEGAPVAEANSINRPGIRHFCAQNHDCAILERAVGDHGGSLIAPPLDLGTGNQYAYARDCEGNMLPSTSQPGWAMSRWSPAISTGPLHSTPRCLPPPCRTAANSGRGRSSTEWAA
jgi:catechol 2,3-dioxygenase-like lactoylglutathione lyase family enzyme